MFLCGKHLNNLREHSRKFHSTAKISGYYFYVKFDNLTYFT